MNQKENILSYLREIKKDLENRYQITKLGLFGSFATEKQNDHSDIDILIEFEAGTENLFEKKNQIRKIISQNFNRDVDLCREKYIKPYFKKQLLKTVIYV
mgnify:CR=1 FL=1